MDNRRPRGAALVGDRWTIRSLAPVDRPVMVLRRDREVVCDEFVAECASRDSVGGLDLSQ